MAQETLKLTITADTAEAAANLQNFIKTSRISFKKRRDK